MKESDLTALVERIRPLDQAAMSAALDRQERLTKPPGSLGRLEDLPVWLAGVRCEQIQAGADVLAAGDMGIGNTTSAAAITAAVTEMPAAAVTGRGTGVSDERLAHKIRIVEQALSLHSPDPTDGIGMLSAIGGFEI